jgi:hypothetical protein
MVLRLRRSSALRHRDCTCFAVRIYGGVIRTELARQERMEPHEVGWARLSRQTSTAVR